MHACMKSLLYPSIDRKLYGLSIPTHGSRSWSWSWAWSCWCPRCPGSRPYIIYWIGFNKTVIQKWRTKEVQNIYIQYFLSFSIAIFIVETRIYLPELRARGCSLAADDDDENELPVDIASTTSSGSCLPNKVKDHQRIIV